MKDLRRSLRIGLMAGVILTAPPLMAQDQPPTAVNQQDEVVVIQLDPKDGADRVLQILRSDDKFETNNYVTKAFEIRNAPAYELRNIIREAVAREKGAIRSARTVPTDGSPQRFFLVVTTTQLQMPTIEETIRAIDVHGFVNSQGSSRAAIRLRYRRASDVAQVLANTRASSQTRIFADDLTNTIYFDDSEFVTKALLPFVEFYDVPIPQIEFDVQIIEVREENASKVGLDWDAWKRSVGGQFQFTGNIFEGGERFGRLDALLALDSVVLANFLNYTVQSGNARLVQRSRLNASNLEPAVISDVRRIPYYDYQRTERAPLVVTEKNPRADTFTKYDSDEEGDYQRVINVVPPVNNQLVDLSSEEEGLLIQISPIIGVEMVTAKIDIAMNTVTGFDQKDRPIVTEQNLGNLFTLRNGEQMLLGTLERQRTVESRRGIPGLKDVPVIKYLFSVESRRTDRSRIFILATPRFSRAAYEAKTLTEMNSGVPAIRFGKAPSDVEDSVLDQVFEKWE